jgi:predicted acetyltransferase
MATFRLGCAIDRRHAALAQPVHDPGRLRMIDTDESAKVYPEVYDRCRRARAGGVTRPDYWWPECYWPEPDHAWFDVVHESASGEPDGFASYEIAGTWTDGHADRNVTVHDLQATNPTARAVLWQFLLDLDLVASVTATLLPADEPLRFLLADGRRLRTVYLNDGLWVFPLDIVRYLGSRTYSARDRIVVAVDGAGYELDCDGADASVTPTTAEPDVACSAATLGAVSLGGNSWRTLADAGLVDGSDDAIARADAMFVTVPIPTMLSWF